MEKYVLSRERNIYLKLLIVWDPASNVKPVTEDQLPCHVEYYVACESNCIMSSVVLEPLRLRGQPHTRFSVVAATSPVKVQQSWTRHTRRRMEWNMRRLFAGNFMQVTSRMCDVFSVFTDFDFKNIQKTYFIEHTSNSQIITCCLTTARHLSASGWKTNNQLKYRVSTHQWYFMKWYWLFYLIISHFLIN